MQNPQSELYQELIIDHGTQPRNCHTMDNPTHTAKGNNPICGDNLVLYLNIKDNVIKDVSFEGQGCAISMASVSIMTEILKDKTIEQAQTLFSTFQDLLTKPDCTKTGNIKLDCLAQVKSYPMRVKCATLGWHALEHALRHDTKEAHTE